MKKALIMMFCLPQLVMAQDVIVKKDGSTILSKVLEVNATDVKYKKFSNQQGPTYTISTSELQAINYENGDKDSFSSSANEATASSPVGTPVPALDYKALAKENLPLIQEFNSQDVVYLDTDTDKKAGGLLCTLGIKDGSIIETPDLKASFSMKKKFMAHNFSGTRLKHSRIGEITESLSAPNDSYMYMIVVTLKNKTDKTIYIDLGTSYVITGGESVPYYIPTSTTTTSGNSSGGSVNMGAVAGALGVGGTLGSLAGGVNVGGGSSSSTSTTTYTQRVVSVPPMASISLEPQSIGYGYTWEGGKRRELQSVVTPCYDYLESKGYVKKSKSTAEIRFEGLKRGEKIDIPMMENATPLSIHVSYSFDEMISQTDNMRIDFYWRQVLGVKHWSDFWKNIDYRKCPLIFEDTNQIIISTRNSILLK